MNLLEILRKVQLKLGRQFDLVGNESIIQDILDAYRDVCIKNNWSFFLKQGTITVHAYKALTVYNVVYSTNRIYVDEAITSTEATQFSGHRCYVGDAVDSITVTAVNAAGAGGRSHHPN